MTVGEYMSVIAEFKKRGLPPFGITPEVISWKTPSGRHCLSLAAYGLSHLSTGETELEAACDMAEYAARQLGYSSPEELAVKLDVQYGLETSA